MARILLIILASCALVACDSFVDCPVPGWWESILSRIPSWIRDRFLTVNATSMGGSSIHWFRKGLRTHDNPALLSAVEDISEFRPIFILDPWFVKNAHVGPNRWRFLIQSLLDLDESFKKLNSRLFVLKGKPSEIFPKIFKDWGVKKLTFEVDTEPYALKRDEEVMKLARDHGVQIVQEISHTLYDTEKTIFKNGGSSPLTYQRMQALIKQMGNPPASVSTLSEENLKSLHTPLDVDHDRLYGVPSLEELGINTDVLDSNLYPGGETEALKRLEQHLVRKSWICNFEKPKTEPNSLEPSTTVLSPYLKFGCLSVRRMYHRLRAIQNTTKKCTQPPVSLDGQLLWREFFYTVGSATPNFDKMEGNSICRQIPWQDNRTHLEAWKQGRTGYPFIDAIMTQLRKEGWIHHLARHAVACFLTRGDLWISWEHGQQVFEELLLDADWSLNAGNWMWLSASAFFHQYFRVYSPVAFGKKTDKEGQYIKNYLPILKKYPKEYIYEPWKAPRSLQEKAGCIIGVDYPQPIVDHDIVHKQNLKKMADAYAKGKELSTSSAASKRKTSSNESRTTPNPKRKKSSKTNSRITDFMPT